MRARRVPVRYRTLAGRDRDACAVPAAAVPMSFSSVRQRVRAAEGQWSGDCSTVPIRATRGGMMDGLLQDVRYGLRVLMKAPAVTGVAILTLALGIGANTAIFSLADDFLWNPLPVTDPEQLVFVYARMPSGSTQWSFPYATFEWFRDSNHSLAGMFAYDDTHVPVTIERQAEYVEPDFTLCGY